MRKLTALIGSVALAVSAAPALSQNAGLVVVDLSGADVNVLNNLAQNLSVTVQQIQALNNVQVPIGLAAAICGVSANIIAKERKSGDYSCPARNSTSALQKAVKQKMAN